MFPDYPVMICRRCTHTFQLDESTRLEPHSMSRFECPLCKYETVGSGLGAFLKFYPRLVKSEKLMTIEGFSLIGYGIGDIMGQGMFSWLKEKMIYKCHSCSHKWSIPFDPNTLRYKENPKVFYCPSCLKAPQPKTTKEFFMSLNQTFEGAFKFVHAQWDIFSPIGQVVPKKIIQSKIYANKFPI